MALKRIMTLALGLWICGHPVAADSNRKAEFKARYAEAMDLKAAAPMQSVARLRALSDDGYARATERLGYFYLKGIGVDQDTDAAIALYAQAVAAGRSKAMVSLGKAYLADGAYQDAIDTLQAAAQAGDTRAEATLAWAHATSRLGPLSDPVRGLADLRRLAQSDVRDAQLLLLAGLVKQPRSPANVDPVIDRLHERHAEGDAKAAEALLRYYRQRGHERGDLATRAALLETPGIRAKVRVEESLWLARARQPHRFWSISETLVQDAPDDVFARALVVTAKINKNAYVRILQEELRAQGYRTGRPSAYMNRPLIRSINQFCRDNGIDGACKAGPLKSSTIKAMAAKIAEDREALGKSALALGDPAGD